MSGELLYIIIVIAMLVVCIIGRKFGDTDNRDKNDQE